MTISKSYATILKVILAGLFLLAVVIVAQILLQKPAEACTINNCGKGVNQGYFTGAATFNTPPGVYCSYTGPDRVVEPYDPFTQPPNLHNCDIFTGYHQLVDYQNLNNAASFTSYINSALNLNFSACATIDRDMFGTSGWLAGSFTLWDSCFQNKRRAVQAAFIVQTMMDSNGSNGSTQAGVNAARANFAAWQTRVNNYAANGWVNFNAMIHIGAGSAWQGGRYGWDVGYTNQNPNVIEPTIVFTNPVTLQQYRIVKSCGNIHGSPISLDIPDYVVQNISPTTAAEGQAVPFSAQVRNQGIATSTSSQTRLEIDLNNSSSSSFTADVTINPNQTTTGLGAGATQNETWPAWTAVAGTHRIRICADVANNIIESNETNNCSFAFITVTGPATVNLLINGSAAPPPIEINGQIRLTWTSTNAVANCTASSATGHWSGSVPNTQNAPGNNQDSDAAVPPATGYGRKTYTITCPSANGGTPGISTASIDVVGKPYVQAFSGDVSAGDGFRNSTTNACPTFGPGTIKAFNKSNFLGVGFAGAGGQLGVSARGEITQFVSASLRTSIPQSPIGLTFANNPATAFGGNMTTTGQCIDDYWAAAPASGVVANPVSISTLGTGAHRHTGNLTIDTSTLGLGQRIALYVEGDVIISGNITYAQPNANVWTASNIPSFYLVVKGSIFVSNAATQLDGHYIALPTGDTEATVSGGIFSTCAEAAFSITLMPTHCGNQLTVYGSVIARQLRLLRTPNSLYQSQVGHTYTNSMAAERFIYSPDSWLRAPDGTNTNNSFDNILDLPPVL